MTEFEILRQLNSLMGRELQSASASSPLIPVFIDISSAVEPPLARSIAFVILLSPPTSVDNYRARLIRSVSLNKLVC